MLNVEQKRNCICFDLDGTLCDVSHRRQYVATKPRNWNAWNRSIINDNPISQVLEVFNALKDRFPIFFVSGRSDDYRDVTLQWFEKHGIYKHDYNRLLMRKYQDHRDDSVVKGEIADEIEKTHNILGVFDDRQRVVNMWIQRGIWVFDCGQGKGNF
jgi:uncharacterized HAD superfamily protein